MSLNVPTADEFTEASTSLAEVSSFVGGAPILFRGPETSPGDAVRKQLLRKMLTAAEDWLEKYAAVIDRAESILVDLREGPDAIFRLGENGYTSAHAAARLLVQDFYLRSYGWLTGKPLEFPLAKLDLELVDQRWAFFLSLSDALGRSDRQVSDAALNAVLRKERIAVLNRLMPKREPLLTPEVRAALEPLRAFNELERERERKQAEIFLLAQGWQPAGISAYLTFPSNVQKVLAAEETKRSMVSLQPPASDTTDQQPPATGAGEQGEGKTLSPSRAKAYGQYLYAVGRNPELANATDREVYNAVKEQLDSGETLPTYATWTKYVRDARAHHDANKHRSREGRPHGKSVVRRDQI